MPELPEVETVRRGLERQTGGFQIERVEVLRLRAIAAPPGDAGAFCRALQGRQVQHWQRRGKYLIAALDQGHWGVHLRMTGQFLWLEAERSAAHPACSHTRVRLWNRTGQELRFIDSRSFAQMWWVPPGEPPETVISGLQRLGPEPFDQSFDAAYLRRRLKGSSRPIKSALLDQSLVAGVGNIYGDEALFAAGIRPQTASGRLSTARLNVLHGALVEVLQQSIGAGGTTFSDFRDLSGTNGNYGGMAWVYRRTGQPCRRCGETIRREKIAGRSSHWCPGCQG
ncbi:MAG: DNA-formamidopyrimidine glycosylase [Synechococcaceae cyanobacterium]|nr:DNA-formamidopyrimidine glycosylase [Synechococcaceae cyanobacterium]